MAYRPTAHTRAKAAQRRDLLLVAARALVAEGGWRALTVAAVARDAGVSTGNVYTHFPDKSALQAETFQGLATAELTAVTEAVAAVHDPASATPAASGISALVEVFAHRALRARRLSWALLAEPADPAVEAARLEYRRHYARLLQDLIERGLTCGELPAQQPRVTAAALTGAIGEALVGPLSPTAADNSRETVIAELRSLCLRAAGASEPLSVIPPALEESL